MSAATPAQQVARLKNEVDALQGRVIELEEENRFLDGEKQDAESRFAELEEERDDLALFKRIALDRHPDLARHVAAESARVRARNLARHRAEWLEGHGWAPSLPAMEHCHQ